MMCCPRCAHFACFTANDMPQLTTACHIQRIHGTQAAPAQTVLKSAGLCVQTLCILAHKLQCWLVLIQCWPTLLTGGSLVALLVSPEPLWQAATGAGYLASSVRRALIVSAASMSGVSSPTSLLPCLAEVASMSIFCCAACLAAAACLAQVACSFL